MKVILAGFSKTGTKTMCAAFRMLGYNTYDFLENCFYLHKEWDHIFEHGARAEYFQSMFAGVDAVTDAPSFVYWEEIFKAFPESKVVLTIRDEDSWYESLKKQFEDINKSFSIWGMYLLTPDGVIRRSFRRNALKCLAVAQAWPRSKMTLHDQTYMKKMYREHNLYVQKNVPEHKLLVHKVSEGWKPLCKFLGVEIPDEPFPHKNKIGAGLDGIVTSHKIMKHMNRQLVVSTIVCLICFCIASFALLFSLGCDL